MYKRLLQIAAKLNKNRKVRRGWQRAVQVMAAVVVFCTTYVLILPAITMQHTPVCGMEEHTHTAECYEQRQEKTLACEVGADVTVVHRHDSLCYNSAGELICTLPEQEVHAHGEDCYAYEAVLACTVTHVHSEACAGTETVQICTLEESEGHAHSDACTGTRTVLVCEEEHEHADGCYEEQTMECTIPESEGHVHGEGCFAVTEIPCQELTALDHAHTEACWQQTSRLICTKQELQLHSHAAECYDVQGNLTCSLRQVVEHIHTEECMVPADAVESVLVCTIEEHIHTDACYPAEEEESFGPVYHCGYSVHTHIDSCYNNDGSLNCTIPEHRHEAICAVEDLDLTADVETREQWETTMKDLELTGVWADDLLAVAKSQLNYQESVKNCVVRGEELLGYTRYGAWYGDDYGKWDDLFISFCLHYAEIDEELMPRESDTARWVECLTEQGLYQDTLTAVPAPGDLVFMDTDEDEKADFAAIVAELLPEEEIQIISGDGAGNRVALETLGLDDETILGFGSLPENPNLEKMGASDISAMLAQLPEADAAQQTLNTYQASGDKVGFENRLQELTAQLDAASAAYDALSDEEKALVTGIEKLTALQAVCSGALWQEISALTTDAALITRLAETAANVVTDRVIEDNETVVLRNQDAVAWQFTAETKAHDGESLFSTARVKVELVLPLTADKAVFDTSAMNWLEDSKLTVETRTIGENRVNCQVLTGVKNLVPAEGSPGVIPGSFTEAVRVKVLNAAHGDQVFVQISAAMEQNDWNGTCWLHQVEEKQIVTTSAFAVSNPMDPDDQQANYESFKASIQALMDQNFPLEQSIEVADQVQDDLDAAYVAGMLSYDLYYDLSMMVMQNLGDPNTIAEAAIGNFWKNEVATPKQNFTPKTEPEIPVWQPTEAASTFRLRRAADNRQQINEYGGEASADDAVFVSKEISPTAQENVFDIELNIVTRDRIETVYNDPDMAVVIVTDISQTMNTLFTNETISRYEAAMDSAEEFIDRFQQEAGAVSRIGYVAFNTHAHKIFDLQNCSTPEKAAQLAREMRTETNAIMDPNGDGSDADYKASHDRFTNIQAGLKMARDMLANVNNKHKFIVFLSDGFPTTYISSGYNGYDPYTSSGNKNNDGVFYDDVMNVYCDYGTSYSDTAAIKAREMAVSIKQSGINIFSIGVDVAGQTIKFYHDDSADRLKTSSTVERREDSYPGNIYEIGHWSTTSAFENWLKGSATTGIGSGEGYYYSSTNTSGLHDAYDAIFEKIKIINGASTHTDWVVSDPMPGLEVSELKNIEFINFWDDGKLVGSVTGTLDEQTGMYDNNTATFDPSTNTITWNLKESIYYVVSDMGDYRNYMFNLRYRVRLENENTAFIENKVYNTNDPTSLAYRLIEVNNGVTVIGEQKKLDFEIPAVHGYLAELTFQKVDPLKNPIAGAEFTLTHDTDNCGFCRGDGVSAVTLPSYVATSDGEGMVHFTRIPSGHKYILTESKVPEGYTASLNEYYVQVSYDNLTVTVTDSSGKELEWTQSIENGLFYKLPNTGGTGTSHFTFGGLTLMGAAALMYICISGHKRKRGGAYRRR